ncbi:AIG2-like family protein [Zalerion maritima]|uniref:gamma-glutamylcyclotransferase n=1 Tax=Zalerion maritima TaxID=339359 RepID=A0AAD5WTQ2_9PEZI|nr:AIG2-like family protein [Zalerion maritima]
MASAAGEWYFAYGANMAASVFVTRRKIQPLRNEAACIRSHALCYNVMGIPYVDPGQGSLRQLKPESDNSSTTTEPPTAAVHGVAYLLTPEDLRRVISSEGGGVAYNIAQLNATLLGDRSSVSVATLIGRRNVSPSQERLPSQRYMGLLIRGAAEQGLPEWYQAKLVAQPTFQPLPTRRYELGVALFVPFWTRMGVGVEKAVYRFQGADGHVPWWFVFVFDCLLSLMWGYHDFIHSWIFGRGDGW